LILTMPMQGDDWVLLIIRLVEDLKPLYFCSTAKLRNCAQDVETLQLLSKLWNHSQNLLKAQHLLYITNLYKK
jgi:hypothetical protein